MLFAKIGKIRIFLSIFATSECSVCHVRYGYSVRAGASTASSSKNYHQIMDTTPSNPPVYGSTEKWTEIEHLPEWDEEFYKTLLLLSSLNFQKLPFSAQKKEDISLIWRSSSHSIRSHVFVEALIYAQIVRMISHP